MSFYNVLEVKDLKRCTVNQSGN